jgi:hypothetical protein
MNGAMLGKAKMDRRGRQVALQIGVSRMMVGFGALFFTRPALRALGFGEAEQTGMALAKLAGGRDLALGTLTVAAHDDRAMLRTLVFVSSVLDAGDAVALGASARHPATRNAGLGGFLSGGAAALAGFWAWRRLGG